MIVQVRTSYQGVVKYLVFYYSLLLMSVACAEYVLLQVRFTPLLAFLQVSPCVCMISTACVQGLLVLMFRLSIIIVRVHIHMCFSLCTCSCHGATETTLAIRASCSLHLVLRRNAAPAVLNVWNHADLCNYTYAQTLPAPLFSMCRTMQICATTHMPRLSKHPSSISAWLQPWIVECFGMVWCSCCCRGSFAKPGRNWTICSCVYGR